MATLRIQSDGDPFPAKAGHNGTNVPKNDGTSRTFEDSSNIADQTNDFTIKYRGGSNTTNPQIVDKDLPIGITTTGVVIYSPMASDSVLPVSGQAAPPGYHWNTIENQEEFYQDLCGGKPETNGEYRYRSGGFYTNGLQSNASFRGSSTYYTNGTEHPDGHSKILGYAFDGYPIYGPMGYSSPTNNASAVIRMESSYTVRPTPLSSRLSGYDQIAQGKFCEDYEYTSSGTLDEYNGRYCVTPDYTNGTYAYFLTFSDGTFTSPAYPYIVGRSTKEQRSS